MSKPQGAPEQKSQKQQGKPEGQGQPAAGGAPKAAPQGPLHCTGPQCKAKDKRFGFCDEHYEQFKFGLIKKTGQPVPDYEKKFEHYQAWKTKVAARKAA